MELARELALLHVADERVRDWRVSTVFLGIDMRPIGDGPPILWETMIFGGTLDGEQWRYSSREQAERGHQAIVRLVAAVPLWRDLGWIVSQSVREAMELPADLR